MKFLAPLLWTAAFLAAVLLGTEAHHGSLALGYFFLLYTALGIALVGAQLVGKALHPVVHFFAAWGGTILWVYHLRELTYRPSSLFLVPLVALLPAAALFFVAHRFSEPAALRKALAAMLAGGALCLSIAAAPFLASSPEANLLRWHSLRHHKLFGTPLYYALSTPVGELEERAFAAEREGAVEGPQDVVLPKYEQMALSERPHLVFLLLDTLRADALEDMPLLQARLKKGYRFTDVLASSTWTRPSMASMMTGLLAEEHGARDVDDPLDEALLTLPEILNEHGWVTTAMVTNVGAVGRGAGFAQGYDEFYELEDRPYSRASKVRRMAEGWLDRRAEENSDDESPFFLYLHMLDPHEPYLAGEEPSAKTEAEYRAAYLAELQDLDRELDALLTGLEERFERPWGLFMASDHGEEFFEHEEFGHGTSLYGEVAHIPAALTLYGLPSQPAEIEASLEGRDLFDLLLRWTLGGGALDPAQWAAEKSREQRYTSIYYRSSGRLALRPYLGRVYMRAIERDGFKLIWSAYGSTFELYNLTNDPEEQQNVALRHVELVTELSAELKKSASRWRFPPRYERSLKEQEQLKALGYLDQ